MSARSKIANQKSIAVDMSKWHGFGIESVCSVRMTLSNANIFELLCFNWRSVIDLYCERGTPAAATSGKCGGLAWILESSALNAEGN